jgi:two-component system, OmpR family, osmolarity sensor histidine kinase EnvZ
MAMIWRRIPWVRLDSLFTRLLLVQVLLAITLMASYAMLFYVERNAAVARLVAERWAPTLRQAAGWPEGEPGSIRKLQRSPAPPIDVRRPLFTAPRLAALNDELRRLGVPVQNTLVDRSSSANSPVLWLQLLSPDGSTVWLGLSDDALLPRIPGGLALAVLLACVLTAGVSWVFTRGLTRPLNRLNARIRSHQPGEPAAASTAIDSPTPEVAAIESAYAELLRRLEGHERERALLLAGVSHDLRGPLARIRLAAGLLPEESESAPWRDAIVRNTLAVDRLIESFLDHVRAGELALDQEADVAAIARGAAVAAGRGADELTVIAPEALPLRHTHPLLLERLIANLLDNAFKHGRAPVELRIEARRALVVIEVSDAGAGVPDEQREQLLQAFARGDAARNTSGTGLGLTIVARVVTRMGGTLAFDRRNGRHVVCVELPRRA